MTERSGYRPSFWRGVFYLIVATGLVLTVVRFAKGLGAVTNLSDQYPWGLWKAFNVLAAVGLGGAGFTVMGTVYVCNAKKFRPIVRPAVLIAFLAYSSVAVALAIDIGRPWAIWHPLVMWNPSSVLFDVAWCLMLYTVVLVLEGSGMIFEKAGWRRLLAAQRAVTLPVVVVGVILSTLHQSSLGSLFLIVPGKLHVLWYTPMLPVLFFISAVGAGLAMVIVLSRLSASTFRIRLDLPLLRDLAHVLVAVLGIYFGLRLFDLAQRGALGTAFGLSYESLMFLFEFLLGVVVPGIMLCSGRVRSQPRRLYAASLLVVAGLVVNRLNVSITGFEMAQGGHYVPTFSEVAITLMLVALAFVAFRTAVRFLNVYPEYRIPVTLTNTPVLPPTAVANRTIEEPLAATPTDSPAPGCAEPSLSRRGRRTHAAQERARAPQNTKRK